MKGAPPPHNSIRGLLLTTTAFFVFFDAPSPLVTIPIVQLISTLSAFWGPPPLSADVINDSSATLRARAALERVGRGEGVLEKCFELMM